MSPRWLLSVFVIGVVAGCAATDPCAGVSGSCLALTVTSPTIAQADTLDITASGAFTGVHSTSAGRQAPLPMRVALRFPATASGHVQIDVVAHDASAHVLGSGQASTTVAAGQHASLTVVLGGGVIAGGDMSKGTVGGDDMTGLISDLAGADLTGAVCSSADDTCADSSTLKACLGDGSGFTMTTCANGCSTSNGAHCNLFYPSNAVTPADLNVSGTSAISIAANTVLNVDTGAIDNIRGASGDTTMPSLMGGVSYRIVSGTAVFNFGSLTVASGATLTLVGTHPVALVSRGDLVIVGVVDARGYSASGTTYTLCGAGTGGPGGGKGVNGGSTSNATGLGAGMGGGGGGALSMSFGSGGGGGGFGAPGGTGGTGSATGGTAGAAYGNQTLIPLLGGSAGGASTGGGAYGGGGGGAVQLVSATKVAIGGGAAAGGVNAGGCGGGGAAFGSGGGGAGSGGAILVEAPVVQLLAMGVLAANGGGGADGNSDSGAPGSLSAASAMPGTATAPGGYGGAHSAGYPYITGANGGTSPNAEGGGGGGGVGRIRINNVSGSLTPDASAILSPATSDLYNTVAAASYGTIDIH